MVFGLDSQRFSFCGVYLKSMLLVEIEYLVLFLHFLYKSEFSFIRLCVSFSYIMHILEGELALGPWSSRTQPTKRRRRGKGGG